MLLKDETEPKVTGRGAAHAGPPSARAWPRMRGEGAGSCGARTSERQWGTVREDYSPYGNAWEYFSHDQARSRAYRWGEDGIAGISDRSQRLCLALALWNGKDPILKERLFGLTNGEGNHSEDVKELYYYLDATPTHSYLKYLYKYPQREFPTTGWSRRTAGAARTSRVRADRYRGVRRRPLFRRVRRVRQGRPEDILMLVTAHNRGPEAATLHVLPQLWFRNIWSWRANANRPDLYADNGATIGQEQAVRRLRLHADGEPSCCSATTTPTSGGCSGRRPATSRTPSTSIWSLAGATR